MNKWFSEFLIHVEGNIWNRFHSFHVMIDKFLLILPTLINIFKHSTIKVFWEIICEKKKLYKNVSSTIAQFYAFFIWTLFFPKHTRENMRKKSGDINPHYVQCLKPQSERVLSYNHLLSEWHYYIFLRLFFLFIVFLKTLLKVF